MSNSSCFKGKLWVCIRNSWILKTNQVMDEISQDSWEGIVVQRDREVGTSTSILDHDLKLSQENGLLISVAGFTPCCEWILHPHNTTQPIYKMMKSKSCLKWRINVVKGLHWAEKVYTHLSSCFVLQTITMMSEKCINWIKNCQVYGKLNGGVNHLAFGDIKYSSYMHLLDVW